MGTSDRATDKGSAGDQRRQALARMGDLLGAAVEGLADQRSAARRTMPRPSPSKRGGRHTTPEELRAKVSATLSWVKPPAVPVAGVGSVMAVPTARVAASASCPKCRGVGWVRTEAGAENDWREETFPCGCKGESLSRGRWQRALDASDMTPELLAFDFASYDATYNAAALRAVSDWTRGLICAREGHLAIPPWIFLYGLTGTGKTRLLAAAFNALMSNGCYPLYTLVPSLLDYVRQGLDVPRGGEYAARFRAVQRAPILILDDLGAEARTAWGEETLFKLLDHRYREALPTAVASNPLPKDLEPRIASRLQDRVFSTALLMAGPDYRLSGGRKAAR